MKYVLAFLPGLLVLGLTLAQQQQPMSKPLAVPDALEKFTTPDDLRIEAVLSEPDIAQPVHLSFDERGRLWVVEYRQYPFPAGLKQLGHDRFWRVVYDQVPPPPPNHFVGKDRITIHEDTNGDGTFDKHSTFIEGLNITSSCARGRGGVFILNPPYLLFYPSKDGDKPDGPPQVLLEGFGLEDSHSVVNSLTWGPDGWLYAAQGSTVSGKVRRYGSKDEPVHSMGQQIWRYHPETKKYEIFAEGGGNAFGVEFDEKGRIFSGHNGGDTRGFHYVQGGYYRKGFDKHGPLANPYTFGYLNPMKSPNLKRFTHTFVVNEGGLGGRYPGQIFAIDPLASKVVLSDRMTDGSTFQTKDVGAALSSTDPWFRPVDLKLGPDGSLYLADFYDQHIAHLRHHEGLIDRDHGRVYRLMAKDAKPSKPVNLGKLTSVELIEKLRDPNRTLRHVALRLLGERRDADVIPPLRRMLREADGQTALEALWALYQVGGLDAPTSALALGHADAHVRAWAVRLVCENGKPDALLVDALEKLAQAERNVEVRSQLGCSARRLVANDGLRLVSRLLERDDDATDPHLPLLYWWAIEAKAVSDRETVLRMFEDSAIWRRKLVAGFVAERVMRRYAQGGTQADLRACARLLRLAPEEAHAKALLTGFEAGTAGRALLNLPKELVDALAARGGGSLTLRLRQRQPEAIAEGLRAIQEVKTPARDRAALIRLLGELQEKAALPVLLDVLDKTQDVELLAAALTSLQAFPDDGIATRILERYVGMPPASREVAQSVLVGRPAWGLALLQAIDAGRLKPSDLSEDVARRLTLHRDARLADLVKKHLGSVTGATTEAMKASIDKLGQVIRTGNADPAPGKKLYAVHCGKCHQLFGEGGQIGPDLTTFRRTDIDLMLLHVVNPSAEIREGFETTVIETTDGRVLQGFLVDRDDQVVILRGAEGQTQVIARSKVEEMNVVKRSIMPENLLRDLSEQQVRDLFAYLRAGQPLQVPEK